MDVNNGDNWCGEELRATTGSFAVYQNRKTPSGPILFEGGTHHYEELKRDQPEVCRLFLTFELVKLCVRARARTLLLLLPPCGNKIRPGKKKEKEKIRRKDAFLSVSLFEWWNRWINKFTWRGNGPSFVRPIIASHSKKWMKKNTENASKIFFLFFLWL